MKTKNLFITLGLALTVGAGVVAGVGLSRGGAISAEAVNGNPPWYVVGTFSGANHWSTSSGYQMTETATNTFKYSNLSLAVGDEFKVWDGTTSAYYQGWWAVANGSTDSTTKAKFESSNGGDDGNIKCKTAGVYNVTFTKSDWHIKIEEVVATKYTVTRYAVLDGVKQSTPLGSVQVVEGDTYPVPDNATWGGYHFGGWYTNEACTTAYTARAINANLDLYAKFTALTADSYVYYVTGSETATTHYIYSYGGDSQFGAWPGTSIASKATEVHGVVRFQNVAQFIYKIPYSSLASDTHIIINKNGSGEGNQTSDMPLYAHSAYWFTTDENYHNDDAGAALDFILEFERVRNLVAADAEHGIKQYSVCGITGSSATALCTAYNALTKDQREDYVDISYTYTYKRSKPSENDNVSFYDMMDQVASQAKVTLNGHSSNGGRVLPTIFDNESSNYAWIIAVIGVASLVAVGGFFFIRKRKENN